MIRVIDASNAHLFKDEMEGAWRLRHQVFVEERGWTELHREDGREIDQFDTPHAVHFLALDAGRVIGYSRLLPTLRPHLLSEVFPHLCDEAPPAGPQIWEWTRQAVAPANRTHGRLHPVSLLLAAGIVEWSLAHGISAFVTQSPMRYMLSLLQLRFRPTALGPSAEFADDRYVALFLRFESDTLAEIRRLRGNPDSVLATVPATEARMPRWRHA